LDSRSIRTAHSVLSSDYRLDYAVWSAIRESGIVDLVLVAEIADIVPEVDPADSTHSVSDCHLTLQHVADTASSSWQAQHASVVAVVASTGAASAGPASS
jgi:hypothetical protein